MYAPDGKLLSDRRWYSSYRSSPELVRVGPKKKKAREDDDTTTTTPTTTQTTTSTQPHR